MVREPVGLGNRIQTRDTVRTIADDLQSLAAACEEKLLMLLAIQRRYVIAGSGVPIELQVAIDESRRDTGRGGIVDVLKADILL